MKKYINLYWIVIILGITVVVAWTCSEGIHQVLFFKRVEIEEKCYILDPSSGEMIESSTLKVNGVANYLTNSFHGNIYLEAMPIPVEEAELRKDNHTITSLWNKSAIHYTGVKATQTMNGEWNYESSRYSYYLSFFGTGGKWIGMIVYDEGNTYEVICAGSFEEAMNRYKIFKAEFFDEE